MLELLEREEAIVVDVVVVEHLPNAFLAVVCIFQHLSIIRRHAGPRCRSLTERAATTLLTHKKQTAPS